jgi:DNA-directed RNA polymerase subunit F
MSTYSLDDDTDQDEVAEKVVALLHENEQLRHQVASLQPQERTDEQEAQLIAEINKTKDPEELRKLLDANGMIRDGGG